MTTPELDVEDFVTAYIGSQDIVAAGNIAARMPDVISPPFVLVQRVAGGDDWIVDSATISIHSFDSDQTSASDIARSIHHAMRQLHAKTTVTVPGYGTANVYRCTIEQTPIFAEWEPGGGGAVLSRYVGRYIIDVRLPSIAGY